MWGTQAGPQNTFENAGQAGWREMLISSGEGETAEVLRLACLVLESHFMRSWSSCLREKKKKSKVEVPDTRNPKSIAASMLTLTHTLSLSFSP